MPLRASKNENPTVVDGPRRKMNNRNHTYLTGEGNCHDQTLVVATIPKPSIGEVGKVAIRNLFATTTVRMATELNT